MKLKQNYCEITVRWLWDDCEFNVRGLWEDCEMTLCLLCDSSSQDEVLFIWYHKNLSVSVSEWVNSQDREPPSGLKRPLWFINLKLVLEYNQKER